MALPQNSVDMGVATDMLGDSLDNIKGALGKKISELAMSIDKLANTQGAGDVDKVSVKDGDIVKLQYSINEMSKASESGTSVWGKGQQISKKTTTQALQG